MAMSVLCWGEILWDLFPDGPRLGGAPANVAFHLAQLGGLVAMASRVGADERGERARALLAQHGVDTEPVQIDRDRPTGAVEVTVVDGEPRYRLTEGCAWEHIELTGELRARLSSANALVYGTLSQRESTGRRALRDALDTAPTGCARVCDPNLRPAHIDLDVVRASLERATVVKLNDVEAELLGERLGVGNVVDWLLGDAGAELVALTRGPRGSVLLTRDARSEHSGVAATPGGDNVGAGDAFTAVLVHLWLRRAPLDAINAAANRYGAWVASQRGATPRAPADLLEAITAPSAAEAAPE